MNPMSKQNTVPDEAKKDVNERDQHHESEFPDFINKMKEPREGVVECTFDTLVTHVPRLEVCIIQGAHVFCLLCGLTDEIFY